MLAGVEGADQVGVFEQQRQVGFGDEQVEDPLVLTLLVFEELQRDVEVGAVFVCAKDVAHAAFTEAPRQEIRTERDGLLRFVSVGHGATLTRKRAVPARPPLCRYYPLGSQILLLREVRNRPEGLIAVSGQSDRRCSKDKSFQRVR